MDSSYRDYCYCWLTSYLRGFDVMSLSCMKLTEEIEAKTKRDVDMVQAWKLCQRSKVTMLSLLDYCLCDISVRVWREIPAL